MLKLIVLPKEGNPYEDELFCARERLSRISTVDLSDLTVEHLENEGVEVVISAGLPKQWYFTLKGMNIVTITLGERDKYYNLSDIVIDCKHDSPKRYFVSPEHSICQNKNFDFEEIVDLIRKLEWDSEFFGFNVAFLSCMHLTENIYKCIDRFIRSNNIRLVEYLCNCHDSRSVRVAEDKGFRFMDIRLEFVRHISDEPEVFLPVGITFGLADEEEIPALRRIAHGLYAESRYHFDPGFTHDKVIEFYKGWVEKGVRGQFDHECCCLFEAGEPVAFCTVRYGKSGTANIGLVGIDNGEQGRGLGKALLHKVFHVLSKKGISKVLVVTQGRNYSAQNLYQSVGFRTKNTQLWYHKWI